MGYSKEYWAANKAWLIKSHRKWYKKNRKEILKRRRKYAKRDKKKLDDRRRKRKYGMAIGTYDKLFSDQLGRCLIGLEENRKLEVDHDHTTGKVRGLLCHRCNYAMGLLGDSKERAARVFEHLSKG